MQDVILIADQDGQPVGGIRHPFAQWAGNQRTLGALQPPGAWQLWLIAQRPA